MSPDGDRMAAISLESRQLIRGVQRLLEVGQHSLRAFDAAEMGVVPTACMNRRNLVLLIDTMIGVPLLAQIPIDQQDEELHVLGVDWNFHVRLLQWDETRIVVKWVHGLLHRIECHIKMLLGSRCKDDLVHAFFDHHMELVIPLVPTIRTSEAVSW